MAKLLLYFFYFAIIEIIKLEYFYRMGEYIMSVLLKRHEQIVNELNILYQVMVAEQLIEAKQLKEKIEKQINKIEADQNLSLYYSLLNFKYKVLTDWTNIKYDTFSQIVRLDNPITEDFITYYYHFFKAEHATIIGNYDEAKKEYEKAESLLKHVPGELEEAEYKYKFAIFNHHTNKPLTAINYANQAKEIFSKYPRYEIKIALCENILGSCSVYLKQFEQAEENYNSAINILQKLKDDTLILKVRNNLGWLYSSQNLSTLAIRHLTIVTNKLPKHLKANFLQAKEHFSLNEKELANDWVQKGLEICNELNNQEYKHHFTILKTQHTGILDDLENAIIAGTTYFNSKELYDYAQEYYELLAVEFHKVNKIEKSQKYFFKTYEAKQKLLTKEALR